MNYKPGRHRSFVVDHEAWYFDELKRAGVERDPSISIVLGAEDGAGCDYEFSVAWSTLGASGRAPAVRVFDESWIAFAECADLFAWMASQSGVGPTPEQFAEGLRALGFEDRTERERREPSASPDKVEDRP